MKPRLQALLPVFVYYSALFPGRRLFPPVEQHPQHAAAGGQHQADPQHHVAAVPGLRISCIGRLIARAGLLSVLNRTG